MTTPPPVDGAFASDLIPFLNNVAQMLDEMKMERQQKWTAYNQEQRDALTALLRRAHTFAQPPVDLLLSQHQEALKRIHQYALAGEGAGYDLILSITEPLVKGLLR